MYPLKPIRIYALDRALKDPVCTARMRRILAAIGRREDEAVRIDEGNLPEIASEIESLWPPKDVPVGQTPTFMRPLVFTAMDLDEKRSDLAPLLKRCHEGTQEGTVRDILGRWDLVRNYHPHCDDQQKNMVCWPTYDFGTMTGCPHGCSYCGDGKWGKLIAIGLNLEDYMERVVGPTVEKYPWQKCFRLIGWGSDIITFEPEYGAFDLFTRKLAQYEGRYGYFHTSGANVDWMAGLERRDRLIGVWSTTCEAVARDIEPGAGKAIDRIEAGRKCNAMGIGVRYKFKPMIPVRGWREEYAWIIEQALKRSRPESVGFCVIMWMTLDELAKRIDLDLLDPEFVEAARKEADSMKGVKTGPFPHRVRAEIYRHLIREVRKWDKKVPVYISTESREMWDELKDEIGQNPRSYICGCSSVLPPGPRLSLSPQCRYSTYSPAPA